MSDIPDNSSDSKNKKETLSDLDNKVLSDDAKTMIQKGVPMDDDIRLDLYDLRNNDASSEELGKMVDGLSKKKKEQVRQNVMGDGEKTSVIDKKGGEILDFPHMPKGSSDTE